MTEKDMIQKILKSFPEVLISQILTGLKSRIK